MRIQSDSIHVVWIVVKRIKYISLYNVLSDENEVQEADSECGDQQGTWASSQANGVTRQPAKPDPAFHGSSEDLLCEYEDLPVEIGKKRKRLAVN